VREETITVPAGTFQQGLTPIEYPEETLHEIITNAVLHRDYSIPDDIHIRIYDNRVEVESPGTLPGHITPENILGRNIALRAARQRPTSAGAMRA
jgi:ATP-dependent DNA helicase RecG